MEESVTYQAIVRTGETKGKLEGARGHLLLVGRRRFGEPLTAAAVAVAAINDLDKLEQLIDRAFDVESWEELLGLPPGGIRIEASVMYSTIVRTGEAKGKLEEARKSLLLVGKRRFGEPSKTAVAAVTAINDPGKLEQLIDRAFDVMAWEALLGLPPKRTRRKSSS
jgi:hypothetical protein